MPPQVRFAADGYHPSFSEPLLSEEEDCDRDDEIIESQEGCLTRDTSLTLSPSSSSSSTSSSSCFGYKSQPGVSRNVTLIFIYTWFAFVGRGIWNQNVLATLVFLLRSGDNTSVGYITAAMGMCQLLISIPTGILADKYRRDTLLKGASVLGVAAVSLSVLTSLRTNYVSLVIALCMWGAFFGVVDTALCALLADSVAEKRSMYFTQRSVIISVANMCGPLVALVMFAVIGDEWSIRGCSIVFLVGNLICLPAVILLCFLNDDEAAIATASSSDETCPDDGESDTENQSDNDDEETGNHNLDPSDGSIRRDWGNNNDDEDEHVEVSLTPLLDQRVVWSGSLLSNCQSPRLCGDSPTAKETKATTGNNDESYDEEGLGELLGWCFPKERIVAILVAIADVSTGLASGMSVRYFAIFLYKNLKLDPVLVQVLYMIAPAVQVGLQKYAQRLGDVHGRCRATVGLKWVGIALMYAMVIAYKEGFPRWTVCAMFILRQAFMNSPAALTKSVLMDSVPKAERAKWASLESVNMFSWSGSAFLGGILVQHYGILSNFTVTAALQFLATLPLLLLSFYGKHGDDGDTTTDIGSADDDDEESNGSEDP